MNCLCFVVLHFLLLHRILYFISICFLSFRFFLFHFILFHFISFCLIFIHHIVQINMIRLFTLHCTFWSNDFCVYFPLSSTRLLHPFPVVVVPRYGGSCLLSIQSSVSMAIPSSVLLPIHLFDPLICNVHQQYFV